MTKANRPICVKEDHNVKRIICILLAVITVSLFASCSQQENNKAIETTASTENTSTEGHTDNIQPTKPATGFDYTLTDEKSLNAFFESNNTGKTFEFRDVYLDYDKKAAFFENRVYLSKQGGIEKGVYYFLSDFILKANAIIEAVKITIANAVQISIGVSISLKFPASA